MVLPVLDLHLSLSIKPITKTPSNFKCHIIFFLCFSKLMWLLKSLLDQNLIKIYHKFNSNFKKHYQFSEDT
jgi:hypothetical protein